MRSIEVVVLITNKVIFVCSARELENHAKMHTKDICINVTYFILFREAVDVQCRKARAQGKIHGERIRKSCDTSLKFCFKQGALGLPRPQCLRAHPGGRYFAHVFIHRKRCLRCICKDIYLRLRKQGIIYHRTEFPRGSILCFTWRKAYCRKRGGSIKLLIWNNMKHRSASG